MKELLPALDRGLFNVYYGPKDVGKTTSVNEGLRGYKGVLFVNGDKLNQLAGHESQLFGKIFET